MEVITTRFGRIEVNRERIIKFPKGILGFPDCHEYVLLQTNEEGSFFWLQAVDRADLAFVVCDPLLFVPDYQIPVKQEDFEVIHLAGLKDAQVLIIVNKIDRLLTGNLQGPLLINAMNRQGVQMVLSEKKFNTRHPLMNLESQPKAVSKTA
jgi:flagellar assembly factor FliW